jgi:hypothetical protein
MSDQIVFAFIVLSGLICGLAYALGRAHGRLEGYENADIPKT